MSACFTLSFPEDVPSGGLRKELLPQKERSIPVSCSVGEDATVGNWLRMAGLGARCVLAPPTTPVKHSGHFSTFLVLVGILLYYTNKEGTGASPKGCILKWLYELSAKTLIFTQSALQISPHQPCQVPEDEGSKTKAAEKTPKHLW